MTYSPAASWLHWTMAIGFACMWALGCTMATSVEEDSPLEEWLYDLHVSLGVTLLALLALRVFVRWWQVPPPLLSELSRFERRAAHARHIALYLFPAATIARGWLETDLSGHTVHWFGVELAKAPPHLEGTFRGASGRRRQSSCTSGWPTRCSPSPSATRSLRSSTASAVMMPSTE